MITQISSMEFKEPHHCYDDNGTGIDFYGYRKAEGNLTDSLYKSVVPMLQDKDIPSKLMLPIRAHRTNANGIVLQMTRNIHWYLLKYIWKMN